MAKDEKEQKLKKKDVIDKRYPPWPFAAIQDEAYFQDVRELCGKGLDPKQDITDQHVSSNEIIKLFGNLKPLKTTSPLLPEEHSEGLHNVF
jgi:hypothetical protein